MPRGPLLRRHAVHRRRPARRATRLRAPRRLHRDAAAATRSARRVAAIALAVGDFATRDKQKERWTLACSRILKVTRRLAPSVVVQRPAATPTRDDRDDSA